MAGKRKAVKRKAGKPKAEKRSTLVNRCDRKFSLYIRLRDQANRHQCPFHIGYAPIECCFHFVTRAKNSLRWDVDNAVGACHGCNFRYEHDPHFAIQWYIGTYGIEKYNALIRRGNVISKWGKTELREIEAGLDNLLEMFDK